MQKNLFFSLLAFAICSLDVGAQTQNPNYSSGAIKQELEKLNSLGSVLYFAAHPDDENTRLIAYLANERKFKTAYLSLTRGDGGQNLIGAEQGIALGLIRTQELLAARRIDRGEQYFSSAYDFGFSKTHQETFEFWEKQEVLREAVWMIRSLRPDVIISRFPPDSRGGHGHHQASAILARQAFEDAANPEKFTEQLQLVQTHQAKRLIWNTATFAQMQGQQDQLEIEIGQYNTLLGKSYGELAAESRSQHKSQGFGAAAQRGQAVERFEHVAGDKAVVDLMDGITTTWARIPDSKGLQQQIAQLNKSFNPSAPQGSVPALLQLHGELSQRTKKLDPNTDTFFWLTEKIQAVEHLLLACSGIWITATTSQLHHPIGSTIALEVNSVVRNPSVDVVIEQINNTPIQLGSPFNQSLTHRLSVKAQALTQPYWLRAPHSLGRFSVSPADYGYAENKDKPAVQISLTINKQPITIQREIHQRIVDPVAGELYHPIAIVPAVTVDLSTPHILAINGESKTIQATFQRNDTTLNNHSVQISAPQGWSVMPQEINLKFENQQTLTKNLTLRPLQQQQQAGTLRLISDNKPLYSIKTISYDHIPTLTWFAEASLQVQAMPLVNNVKKVAYISGAGDLTATMLNDIGIATTVLPAGPIVAEDLAEYDAVVVGIRYFNRYKNSEQVMHSLLEYSAAGGVVVVQYQVNNPLYSSLLGPHSFQISRTRVTQEDAKVIMDRQDPALNYPNRIDSTDFAGWVQERGLYFAEQIDPRYRSPLTMADQNEGLSNGSLLIAKHGQGKFVYTSLSFFRQLSAGVPGAYRLFVNLLHKEN